MAEDYTGKIWTKAALIREIERKDEDARRKNTRIGDLDQQIRDLTKKSSDFQDQAITSKRALEKAESEMKGLRERLIRLEGKLEGHTESYDKLVESLVTEAVT